MYGDFSRDVFSPDRNYTRVLLQQGRPLTDADWNEQVSLLLERQREFIADLMNWHGTFDGGFAFIAQKDGGGNITGYMLHEGSYYVNGLRCNANNERISVNALNQIESSGNNTQRLLYLAAWERSVSPLEDARLLEPALNGIDTSWRAGVEWEVRGTALPMHSTDEVYKSTQGFEAYLESAGSVTVRPKLKVALRNSATPRPQSPCDSLPSQADNAVRLYRVEIHGRGMPFDISSQAGSAAPGGSPGVNPPTGASILAKNCTYKWSRVNGSQIHAIDHTGRLDAQRFSSASVITVGAAYELLDADGHSVHTEHKLLRLTAAGAQGELTLDPAIARITSAPSERLAASRTFDPQAPLYLRRWDHTTPHLETIRPKGEGDLVQLRRRWECSDVGEVTKVNRPVCVDDNCLLAVSTGQAHRTVWIELDDDLVIAFDPEESPAQQRAAAPATATAAPRLQTYQAGDYWLIRVSGSELTVNGKPATATTNAGAANPIPSALGVQVAPLGTVGSDGLVKMDLDDPPNSTPPHPHWARRVETLMHWGIEVKDAPTAGATAPVTSPAAGGGNPSSPHSPTCDLHGLLSTEGLAALRRQVVLPQDILRRVPARSLKLAALSLTFQKWSSTALVSELARQDVGKLLERLRKMPGADQEWAAVEADAKQAVAVASQFAELVISGGGVQQLLG